ncbi:PKD domain-containing protein [Accumulibacter sp.]|uniref:PKD domain-containing protein n=1 Tax=Accumulibacter sp. TaxID=2053492 RepID=UPI0035B213B9
MGIEQRRHSAGMASTAFRRALLAIVLALGSFILAVFPAAAAPSVGAVQLAPTSIAAGVQTTVRVTAVIGDPTVLPSSVNLQRLNDAGAPVAILGTLRDDGVNGDAVAGDQIYTLDFVVSETAPLRLRVSAGFKGMLRRLFSAEMLLQINRPPVADAGRDRDVAVGMDVEVDGRLSHDPDGDRLTYLWTLEQRPAGSSSELVGADRTRPLFVADQAGDYLLRLVVNDGKVDSAPAVVRIHASATNSPPTADAGSDQSVAAGSLVRLDGRRSVDPEGLTLAYAWELAEKPAASAAALDDPASATPAFVADVAGRYVMRLVVSDGAANSAPDDVIVSAHGGNTPPTAVPGLDQSVAPGSRVELDGSGSFDPDPGDGVARFAWSFVAVPHGSSAALLPAIQVFPDPPLTAFVADVAGDYVIELVVTDHRGARSAPRRLLIQAGSPAALKPVLTRLAPEQAVAGSGALVLSVEGVRFDPAAIVVFGTTPLNTRFINATRLSADLPAALLAMAGTYPVVVRNPAVAGGESNSRPFVVGAATPILNVVVPSVLEVGRAETLSIGGANFTPASQVRFGANVLATRFGSESSLSALVPASLLAAPGSVPVTVADPRAGISNAIDVTIASRLAISGISPAEGAPGTVVTIDGSGFVPAASGNQVRIGGVAAGVVSATAGRLTVTVPLAAQSGPVSVTTARGTVSGPVFTVRHEQDFQLVASPAELRAVPGSETSLMVQLGSTGVKPFTGVARLSVAGLPAGVAATFSSPSLTAGRTASLDLTIPSTLAASTYTARVDGVAPVDGGSVTRSATFKLKVVGAAGATGVSGRFVDVQGRGIAAIIVRAEDADQPGSNLGQTTSDAGGNFLFVGLPAAKITLRIDATPANPGFPIWPYTLTLQAGKITTLSDWTLQPPPRDELFTPLLANHSVDQVIANPEVPGLSVRVPAGVTIEGWDGVVKSRMAIERVAPDKLPTEPAPNGARSYYRISFGTPMGGVPINSGSGPAAVFVTVPNETGLPPGAQLDHWYYWGTPLAGEGGWRKAGSGTVSADGKTITANANSGIDRFCGVCGFSCFTRNWDNPSPPCPDCDVRGPPGKDGVNPVTLALGMELSTAVDLVIDGVMPITIGRSYYPWSAFIRNAALSSSLGHGWMFSYDWIVYVDPATGQVRLILPGNAQGVVFTPSASGDYEAPGDLRFGGARLDSRGGPWRLTFKDGRVWTFSQIGFVSWLTEQRDRNGNVLRIERNGSGRPTTISAPGKTVSIGIDSDGLIEVVRDAERREVRYSYWNGRLARVTAPDGGVTSYTYKTPPPPILYVSGGGGNVGSGIPSSYPNRSDGPIYIESISLPGVGSSVELDYATSFRALRQTVGGQREIRFAYELNGTCAVQQMGIGGGCAGANGPREESVESRAAGWTFYGGEVIATRVYDVNGNGYKVRFNAAGLGIELVDADGQSTQFERDVRNRITKITDSLGRVTQYAYDGNSNITQIIDAAGRATDLAYHPLWNKVTSITRRLADGTPVIYRFEYEDSAYSAGKLLRAIDPLGNVTQYGYTNAGDAKGLVQKVTDPLGNVTTLAYSPAADLAAVTDALGNSVEFQRDLVGRLQRVTDALGASTFSEYNRVDQVTRITDANSGVTSFSYDGKRDPTAVVDPLGRAVESYVSDDLHRLTRRTDAKGGVETYDYDAAGRLQRAVDRKVQAVSLDYDRQNRVRSVAYADGNNESRDYDAGGRLISIRDNAGTITFTYDDVDRVVREITDVGGLVNSVEYEYDALDRRVKRTLNGADPTIYTYDLASRLTGIDFRGRTVRYEWDNASRLTAKVLPNGIRQEYAYDRASRLLEIRFRKSDGTLLDSITYAYDANGRRVARTMNLPTNVETPMQGTYDEANRMTSITFPATGQTCTLAYDANGNLASKACPGGTTTYTWDARDRLIAIAGPGLTASFKYDALGRRVQRVVNGQTTGFLYDGVQALAELGANEAALLTGLAIDEAIGRFAASGDRTLLTDALGSVVAEARADQTIATAYGYSPYGETLRSGEDGGNSNQYTGRENDGTGMYYYRARYYEPALKRFGSEDPMRLYGRGTALYSLVRNDPLDWIDPLGLFNVLIGVNLDMIFSETGATLSGFLAVNPECGVFFCGTVGHGDGWSTGPSAFVGYVRGGIGNVEGKSTTVDLGYGSSLSGSGYYDDSWNHLGTTWSVGPSITFLAVAQTNTKCIKVLPGTEDVARATDRWMRGMLEMSQFWQEIGRRR